VVVVVVVVVVGPVYCSGLLEGCDKNSKCALEMAGLAV